MEETKWYGSFDEMRQYHRQSIGTNTKNVFEPKVADPKPKAKKKALAKKEAKTDE